jgi:hypothetical protein
MMAHIHRPWWDGVGDAEACVGRGLKTWVPAPR